jgi:hypothetical protein
MSNKKKVAIFTSINSFYLDKAINLGRSVNAVHDNVDFYIVMSENTDSYKFIELGKLLQNENIKLIPISDLNINRFEEYVFQRTVVELCTAVKGRAIVYFAEKLNYSKVIYLDPDIHVFKPLDNIIELLDLHDTILIPHQSRPAKIQYGIDAELTSMQFGIFNLGFLAVSNRKCGLEFANWWAERLDRYCFDDRAKGLFTDQKWCDLAPALFDNVFILRDLGYDSAPWNTHTGQMAFLYGSGKIYVDDYPLVFFHFSSFDSGTGLRSCQQMGYRGQVQAELFIWYGLRLIPIREKYEKYITKWTYGVYFDGSKIEDKDRLIVKTLSERKVKFGDPFTISGKHFIKSARATIKV